MNTPLRTEKELRSLLNQEIKAIRDMSFPIQDDPSATPKDYDSLARQIKSHTDCIKDLAYELGQAA